MTAFTDQFSKYDPRAFKPSGDFEILISWFASDACALLRSELSLAQLEQVAVCLDNYIAGYLPPGPRRSAVALDELFTINDPSEPLILAGLPFEVKQWEPYAVFSLWKLIDAQILSEADAVEAIPEINANIVMAANALQAAHRIAGERFGTARNKLSAFESRSSQARKSVRFRWQERDEHHQFALRIAPKFEFKQRIKVARAIADEIQVEFGKAYGEEIVDGWLKAAHWKSTI